MLLLDQILNKMKEETLYFESVYSINRIYINVKDLDYCISFKYRNKDFILVKPIYKTFGYILQGNFIVGKIDLNHTENHINYDIKRECDNVLDNPYTTTIRIIKPNENIFKKLTFDDIFIRNRK